MATCPPTARTSVRTRRQRWSRFWKPCTPRVKRLRATRPGNSRSKQTRSLPGGRKHMFHASHNLLVDWPATLALLVIGLAYVRGWVLLRRAVPAARSMRQLTAFAIGLSALWVALGSPLAAFHHQLLSV